MSNPYVNSLANNTALGTPTPIGGSGGGVESVTSSGAAGSTLIATSGTDSDVKLKTVLSGPGVVVSENTQQITIEAPAGTFQGLTDVSIADPPVANQSLHWDAVQTKFVQTPELAVDQATRNVVLDTNGAVSLTTTTGTGGVIAIEANQDASLTSVNGDSLVTSATGTALVQSTTGLASMIGATATLGSTGNMNIYSTTGIVDVAGELSANFQSPSGAVTVQGATTAAMTSTGDSTVQSTTGTATLTGVSALLTGGTSTVTATGNTTVSSVNGDLLLSGGLSATLESTAGSTTVSSVGNTTIQGNSNVIITAFGLIQLNAATYMSIGYTPTNDRSVVNKSYSDGRFGSLYVIDNPAETVITTVNVPVQVGSGSEVSTTQGLCQNFSQATKYVLRCDSPYGSKIYKIDSSVSATKVSGGAATFEFKIYKNGIQIPGAIATREFSGTDSGSLSVIANAELDQTDLVQLYVTNKTGNANITITAYAISAFKIS